MFEDESTRRRKTQNNLLGSQRIKCVIQGSLNNVKDRGATIELSKSILSKQKKFSKARVDKKIQNVNTHREIALAPNAIIQNTGMEISPLLLGKKPYGKLCNNPIELVCLELRFRSVAFDQVDRIRNLVKKLRENEDEGKAESKKKILSTASH